QAPCPYVALTSPTGAGYSMRSSMAGISQTKLDILKKYAAPAAVASSSVEVGPPNSPTVTIPTGILPVTAPNYQNAYYGVGSIDYNISDRDQLRGRFLYNRLDTIDISGTLPAFFILQPVRNYLATLSEYHNFTASVNNEIDLGH